MTFSGKEWSTKPDARADCLTCGWQCLERNAHGVGAQHARKHGHTVRVEVVRAHYYEHGEKAVNL